MYKLACRSIRRTAESKLIPRRFVQTGAFLVISYWYGQICVQIIGAIKVNQEAGAFLTSSGHSQPDTRAEKCTRTRPPLLTYCVALPSDNGRYADSCDDSTWDAKQVVLHTAPSGLPAIPVVLPTHYTLNTDHISLIPLHSTSFPTSNSVCSYASVRSETYFFLFIDCCIGCLSYTAK